MKPMYRILRWGGLAAAVVVATAMSFDSDEAAGTKPFRETGTEPVVSLLAPGSLQQPLFVEARARYGPERWSGVILQLSKNNVGGRGSGIAFEAIFVDPTAPKGIVAYALKYEVLANGDKLVMAGYFIPQLDGSYVANLQFVPAEGTGRFAGATGLIDVVRAIPGGYVFEGTISTVGATK